MNPDGFHVIKEKSEPNLFYAMVLQKEDIENPIFRIDMIIEKMNPRQIFEVLRDHSQVSTWFGKNI